jgi:transposase
MFSMEARVSSRTIHTKPNGKKYVYEVTSYWDKEKKAPRNKQVCLGRLDETTGEINPSKRRMSQGIAVSLPTPTATTLVIGPTALLNHVAEGIGLTEVLKKCFPKIHLQILSLAFFLVQKGIPLSRCETWSVSHQHPYGRDITSQRVSDMLHALTADEQHGFFRMWMGRLAEKECFYYDITSVSSYSEQNEYVRFGYNRDREKLPQINLAMLYGQQTGLPGYFRRLPGNISDVSTLETTVKSLDFVGQTRLEFIMDRGFYKEENVDMLFESGYRFILMCPKRKWTDELYERYHDEIVSSQNRHAMNDHEVLYMLTVQHQWKGRRCYAHIYYNNVMAATDLDEFMLKLALWREELVSDNKNPENTWAYERYFTVKDMPKRGRKVIENHDAVEKAKKKHMGFFCLLTRHKTDALTALEIYRNKEAVENCFDDLKNMLDMKRLRIHSSQAMDARLFIQFIALILLSKVRQIKDQNLKLKNLTIREIMELMETITEVCLSNRRSSVVTEAGPIQREIMKLFGIDLKT